MSNAALYDKIDYTGHSQTRRSMIKYDTTDNVKRGDAW